MKSAKKKSLIGAAGIGILVLLLIGLAAAVKRIVHMDAFKSKIIAGISETTGGDTQCKTINLRFFPKPRFTLTGVYLTIPSGTELSTQHVEIFPDLFRILKGQIKLTRLEIKKPLIKIPMPSSTKDKNAPLPLDKNLLQDGVAAFFGIMGTVGPDTVIIVNDGDIDLLFDNAPDIQISQLHLITKNKAQKTSVSLECISTLSGQIRINTVLDTATKDIKGKMTLNKVNARPLLHYFSLAGDSNIADTDLNMDLDFQAKGEGSVQTSFSAGAPLLQYTRKGKKIDFNKTSIKGIAKLDADSINVTLDEVKADAPRLDLKGFLAVTGLEDKSGKRLNIHLEGKGIDAADVRKNMLTIAGDMPGIQTAFKIVKQGYLPTAVFRSEINIVSGKWKIADIHASGRIKEATISIPEVNLEFSGTNGQIAYDNKQVEFNEMSGHFSGVAFDKLHAKIDWEDQAVLSVETSKATAQMEILYPWLTAFEGLSKATDIISSVDGVMNFSKVELNGPLIEPKAWRLKLKGHPKIQLQPANIKEPLTLSGGTIFYAPDKIGLINTRAIILDADLTISGDIHGTTGDPHTANASIDGAIGEKTIKWLAGFFPTPRHLYLKPPVTFTNVQLKWNKKPRFDVSGHLSTAGGITLLADVTYTPKSLVMRNIRFNDNISNVTISLEISDDKNTIEFSGTLRKGTLDRILADNRILTGWIQGDMKVSFHRHQPINTTMAGNLQGEGLFFRYIEDLPFEFSRFSAQFDGSGIRTGSADVIFADTEMHLAGNADFSPRGLMLDVDVDTEMFNADILEAFARLDNQHKEEKSIGWDLKRLTYLGTIRFHTPEFIYKQYKWKPMKATIVLDEGHTNIFIDQADICGISTPGRIHITPNGVKAKVTPVAKSKALSEPANCFLPNPVEINGLYNLNGTLDLNTKDPAILEKLTGHFKFHADEGRIDELNTLTKIFAVLNITELFTGNTTDLAEKGFGYKKIDAAARINGGDLILDEIIIDGNAMKITGQGTIALNGDDIDIRVLVAPLKTIDRIVNKLPVISYIMGGSLISFPLKITGSIQDTKVVTMPPREVGKGLLNIMERTLKVPFKLVESK